MRKIFFIPIIILACASCQPSDEECAQLLVAEVRQLVEKGQWRQARIVLDSLHVTYPKQVTSRRSAKALEDSITYLEALRTLAYVDTLLPPLLEQSDKLIKQFKYEKNDNYETYGKYVHRLLVTSGNTSRNFLQAYVRDDRQTVVKSYYYGVSQVYQQSITLSANEEKTTFSGRNHHFQQDAHHEILTLENDNALALLNFISTHHAHRIRVEGRGNKSTHNWVYYLNDKEKDALSATYQLGWLMKDINQLEQMQRVANAQVTRYNQKK